MTVNPSTNKTLHINYYYNISAIEYRRILIVRYAIAGEVDDYLYLGNVLYKNVVFYAISSPAVSATSSVPSHVTPVGGG